MITLYSGTPGSGKSYHVALKVYRALRYQKRRYVITNVNFNLSASGLPESSRSRCIFLENGELLPSRLVELSKRIADELGVDRLPEGSIILVLDEAQLLFNARSWQLNDNKGWIGFFSQHRKLGYDVIMIAQADRMIDRQIRSLIEYEVVHRKISRFGIKGLILSWFIGSFVSISLWYGLKEITSRDYLRYRKKVAALYDTYQVWN